MDSFIWRNHTIPRIALGTVQLGLPYGINNTNGQPDLDLACEIVKVAWDNGVRFFDTAQSYGQSESVLGRVFAALRIAEQAQVITKLDLDLESKSTEEIRESIERSRLLLGVPKLFGVMLHRGCWLSRWHDRYAPALKVLQERGITSFIGVSIYSESEINLAFELPEIDLIQVPFNVFDQRAVRLKWFERARELGKLIFTRSIYLQGLLLMPFDKLPPRMEFARPSLDRFYALCRHLRISQAGMAMAYVANKSFNTSLLFGAETPAQVLENISLYDKSSISQSTIDEVESCFAGLGAGLINPSLWPTT